MSFNAIFENKILAKISKSTVILSFGSVCDARPDHDTSTILIVTCCAAWWTVAVCVAIWDGQGVIDSTAVVSQIPWYVANLAHLGWCTTDPSNNLQQLDQARCYGYLMGDILSHNR